MVASVPELHIRTFCTLGTPTDSLRIVTSSELGDAEARSFSAVPLTAWMIFGWGVAEDGRSHVPT